MRNCAVSLTPITLLVRRLLQTGSTIALSAALLSTVCLAETRVVATTAVPVVAQGGKLPDVPSDASDANRLAQRELAALEFARQHHAELAVLLDRLKSMDAGEYKRAIADIAQAGERLERMRETDPARYQLSLRSWVLDSQIRLIAARMTMKSTTALEKQLRNLLEQRATVRLELLRLDHAKMVSRVERLQSQILELETNTASRIDEDFERLTRATRAGRTRSQVLEKSSRDKMIRPGETKSPARSID